MTGTQRARDTSADVAGLLLAAGGGRRLGGRPKALLEHRGALLVERAAEALRAGGCGRVHVVLGAGADRVRARARLPGCVLVDSPHWEQGMGASLRAGLASLAGTGARAALVLLVDQPGIGERAVRRVLEAGLAEGPSALPGALVLAEYAGARGHPVLFGRAHWAGIAARAEGDQGARAYLREREAEVAPVDCADVADPHDIDTEADLARLRPGR
ncbi:nucleotidyltransferase family protein [Streptomyces chilikensis]|uniref:nucleotidyltransferase family protein n=1 Tax=Streptomyces chilikensis TaxID=1194079 RepID=UPI00140BC64D|nr:nucleotidyltransferase family protein [Streptomyces chilikensis]